MSTSTLGPRPVSPRTAIVPVLRHGLTGWDPELLPKSEFERRLDVLRRRLEREGFDQLLVYGNALASGPVAYLSNFHVSYPARGAVVQVTADSATVFAQMPTRNARAMQPHVSLPIVACSGVRDAVDRIAQTGAGTHRVAISSLDNMLWRDAARVDEVFDEVVEVDWISVDRRRKSSAEVAIMGKAAAIASTALDAMANSYSEDSTEAELAGLADYIARSLGCQDSRILFASPENSAGLLRRPKTQADPCGESLRTLVGVQWHGYWVEIGDTLTSSDAGPEVHEARRAALRSLDAAAADSAGPAGTLWVHGVGLDTLDEPANDDPKVRQGDTVSFAVATQHGGATAFAAATGVVSEHGIEFLAKPE